MLIVGATQLAPLVVWLASPVFHAGFWPRTGGVLMGLHGLTVITALGLFGLAVGAPRVCKAIVLHPFVLVPLGLAAWSLAVAPSVEFPLLSWFGAPEIGEGIAWHLQLAVLTAGAMLVVRMRRAAVVVAGVAALSICVVCALSFWASPDAVFSPYPRFRDHFAFYGICVPAILIAFCRTREPWLVSACLLPGLVIVAMSANRAALLFCFVLAPILVFALTRTGWPPARKRLAGSILATAMPFAGIAGLYLLGELFGASYWSRARLSEIVLSAIGDDPRLLLTGAGWGSFTDALLAHAGLAKVSFVSGLDGGPNWDALQRIDFHSHNFLAEALLSAGLVGALMALALPAAVPWFCRARYIGYGVSFGIVLAGIATAWFQYPGSVPYLALALGALARPLRWRAHRSRVVAAIIAPAALVIASAMALTLERSVDMVRQITSVTQSATWARPAAAPSRCAPLIDDSGRGGSHLAPLVTRAVGDIKDKIECAQPVNRAEVHALDALLCAVDRYIDAGANLRLTVLAVVIRSDLAFALKSPAIDPLRARYLRNWHDRIEYVLERAPRRSDLAAPYLYWRLNAGDDAAVQRLAKQILRATPRDVVGMWFHGITLLNDPDGAERGLAEMRASLAAGLERRIPVEPAWRELLTAP